MYFKPDASVSARAIGLRPPLILVTLGTRKQTLCPVNTLLQARFLGMQESGFARSDPLRFGCRGIGGRVAYFVAPGLKLFQIFD
jgi:hypothetical protein